MTYLSDSDIIQNLQFMIYQLYHNPAKKLSLYQRFDIFFDAESKFKTTGWLKLYIFFIVQKWAKLYKENTHVISFLTIQKSLQNLWSRSFDIWIQYKKWHRNFTLESAAHNIFECSCDWNSWTKNWSINVIIQTNRKKECSKSQWFDVFFMLNPNFKLFYKTSMVI